MSYKKTIVALVVAFILAIILLAGIKTRTSIIIVRNVKKSPIVLGWTPSLHSINASRVKNQCMFEANILESDFLDYCQANNWPVEPFSNVDEPLEVTRYNWVESFDTKGKSMKIENRNIDQSVHYIKHGYQYNNLSGEKNSDGIRIFIAYDIDMKKVYACYYNR